MIKLETFLNAVFALLIDFRDDPGKLEAVKSPGDRSMIIVAGPGSGKTAIIVMCILKRIFVDGTPPSRIVATTFTKRAAGELQSRILRDGEQLRAHFLSQKNSGSMKRWLGNIDLNTMRVGTIDSISQEVLTDNRKPGTSPPIVIDSFVVEALMTKIILRTGLYKNRELATLLEALSGGSSHSIKNISSVLVEINDRMRQDLVDIEALTAGSPGPGTMALGLAHQVYLKQLSDRLLYDYARLEEDMLRRLASGELNDFLDEVIAVYVDEYQDTNPLQERIYFLLAAAAIRNGGNIVVVGDDDQSLYRFRGATVNLFSEFPHRVHKELGISPVLIELSGNYRSSQEIVDFCNSFIALDSAYQSVRAHRYNMVCRRDSDDVER